LLKPITDAVIWFSAERDIGERMLSLRIFCEETFRFEILRIRGIDIDLLCMGRSTHGASTENVYPSGKNNRFGKKEVILLFCYCRYNKSFCRQIFYYFITMVGTL
jgi:hypothetical protein